MASVDFQKVKGASEAKALFRHSDKAERLAHDHTNEQIDKSATRANRQLPMSYAETCRRYDERIAKLDGTTNTNKRKDRVTLMGLCVPFPKGLSDKNGVSFCNECLHILRGIYGTENVLQAYIHFDEKHEYTDARTGEKTESRSHVHFYIVPEKDGVLNAKVLMNKGHMIQVNNAIHEMVEDRFGLQFMDGSGRKSKKSVSELKNASRERELSERKATLDAREASLRQREEALRAAETRQNAFFETERENIRRMKEKAAEVTEMAQKAISRINALKTSQLVPPTVRSYATKYLDREVPSRKQIEQAFSAIDTQRQDEDDTEYT